MNSVMLSWLEQLRVRDRIVMLMKSHKGAGGCFAVMLFLLIADWSANNSATMATFQNASAKKDPQSQPNVVGKKTFVCRIAKDYSFVVVENPNRQKDSDPVVPKDLNIVVGDEVISKIELPKESEVKNFGLKFTEKTKTGFEIKVDWGGDINHYEIQFNFRCKGNSFYLYRVKKASFSTTNPDSGNFLDKKKTNVTKIQPNVRIEKFVMKDYL